MELLGDMGPVESLFYPFRDSGVGAIWVHGLHKTYHRLKWKLISVLSGIVPILMQHRCTICINRTLGLEIILDSPNGTPR
jgi:hypothetical protein